MLLGTVCVVTVLTSCNSTPRDFAQSAIDMQKENLRFQIDLYKEAAKSKDPEFMDKYTEKMEELYEMNSEYSAAKKKRDKALENYQEMLKKEWS